MPQMLYVADGLYALALLACPIGMGLMMLFMMRGRHRPEPPRAEGSGTGSEAQTGAELLRLRAEVDELRAAVRPGDLRPSGKSDVPR